MGRQRRAQGITRTPFSNAGRLVTVESGQVQGDMEGAFVRFFPTEGMTADDITQIRLDLYAAGARVVRTMPRPAARLVPANAKGRAAAKQGTTPRQRVAQWVDGLNVEYADDLRAMLDDALSSAGL